MEFKTSQKLGDGGYLEVSTPEVEVSLTPDEIGEILKSEDPYRTLGSITFCAIVSSGEIPGRDDSGDSYYGYFPLSRKPIEGLEGLETNTTLGAIEDARLNAKGVLRRIRGIASICNGYLNEGEASSIVATATDARTASRQPKVVNPEERTGEKTE